MELKKGLTLELNDKPLELKVESKNMVFPPGAGGLPTTKITVEYVANIEKGDLLGINKVFYKDSNYLGRTGWKEIIVLGKKGETYIADSSAPSEDISNELSSYPQDAISSPPQDLEASFSFSLGVGKGIASTKAQEKYSKSPRVKTPRNSFTEILTKKDLTFPIILFSLAIAFGFGAFHALSPGHGKTIVAAYLVGSRGTAGHALLLGTIVTLTHTIGVFALGLVTLYASRYILPEKLYPWLGFASGLMIVIIGISLFFKRLVSLRREGFADHGHSHHPHSHAHTHHHGSHSHTHHDHLHDHKHNHGHHHHEIPEKVTFGSLLALGVSGGIVPCPEALIVLISAISLHRIGFGLILIVAFSTGLALILMGIGLAMVYAKRFMERFSGEGRIIQTLPLLSSVVITILGFGIAIQSLISGGILQMDSVSKII